MPAEQAANLSVPYFTGFVMLPQVSTGPQSPARLSVPYFTGFVMLQRTPEAVPAGYRTFSPLFYGIRDATVHGQIRGLCQKFFQSPILRDS